MSMFVVSATHRWRRFDPSMFSQGIHSSCSSTIWSNLTKLNYWKKCPVAMVVLI